MGFMPKMNFSLTEYIHVVTWMSLPSPATPKIAEMAKTIYHSVMPGELTGLPTLSSHNLVIVGDRKKREKTIL